MNRALATNRALACSGRSVYGSAASALGASSSGAGELVTKGIIATASGSGANGNDADDSLGSVLLLKLEVTWHVHLE